MTIVTKIEKAFGADLTANPATWTWTDVSAYALGEVSVTAGRSDEAGTTQSTRCIFRLRNTDSRFSPRHPTSPYYPNVRRQTPVRISLNPGTGYVQRFQGYVDEIVPSWPSGNSDYAEVTVTASGSLRRLGQGNSPLRSSLERAIVAENPLAYWPMEDGSSSTQIASALPGHPAINEFGLTFASNTGLVGSAALPVFTSTASIVGPVISSPSASQWQWDWHYFMPGDPGVDTVVMQINTSGTITIWQYVVLNGGTTYSIRGYDNTGALAINRSFATLPQDPVSGAWSHWSFYVQDGGGGTVNYAFHYYPSLGGIGLADGGSFSGTPGQPASWGVPPSAGLSGTSLGHVVLYDAYNYTQPGLPAFGYVGETADARLTRLCAEEGVPITITGTSPTTMGPQGVATFLTLLRECETADLGILYDGAGPGLSYLARGARYNPPVSTALDTKRQQVKLPFAPVEDDQRVRNDWTVGRPNGSSVHVTDPVHIAANGLYDTSLTINIQSDRDLREQAAWRVHLGTVEEMRVPGLSLQLIDRPELWPSWLATTLGGRVTAANLPAQYPPGTLDMIVEGYTETWDSVSWRVDINTSPSRPWEVFSIADTRLGRIETAGSTLNSSATSTALSLSVASSGGLWATGVAFDLDIEGERVTATFSGSSSPQTAAVTRSVNGVVKAHNPGAVVKLWKPGVLAL